MYLNVARANPLPYVASAPARRKVFLTPRVLQGPRGMGNVVIMPTSPRMRGLGAAGCTVLAVEGRPTGNCLDSQGRVGPCDSSGCPTPAPGWPGYVAPGTTPRVVAASPIAAPSGNVMVESTVPGFTGSFMVPSLVARLQDDMHVITGSGAALNMLAAGNKMTPAECAPTLRGTALNQCATYPDSCRGVDQNAVIGQLCDQYRTWYETNLAALHEGRAAGTSELGLENLPPAPDWWEFSGQYTSGPGWAAQQAAAATGAGAGSSGGVVRSSGDGSPATASGGRSRNGSTGASSGGSGSGSSAGAVPNGGGGSAGGGGSNGGGSAAGPSLLDEFLGKKFSIFGFDVPVWAAAVGGIGTLWLVGGRR